MLFLIVFAAVRTREQLLWVVGAFVVGALLSAIYGIIVPPPPQDIGRLAGAGGDPNETAAALVAGRDARDRAGGSPRGASRCCGWPCAVAAVVCLFALFLTLSRGGLIALGVALIAAVVLGGRRRGTMLGGRGRRRCW